MSAARLPLISANVTEPSVKPSAKAPVLIASA